MKSLVKLFVMVLTLMVATTSSTFASRLPVEAERDGVRSMVTMKLKRFEQEFTKSSRLLDNCYGYCIMGGSETTLALIGIGRGRGIAVNNVTGEQVFMRMKNINLSFGGGSEEFAWVFILKDKAAWDKFLSGDMKYSTECVAALSDGKHLGAWEGTSFGGNGIKLYQMTTKGWALAGKVRAVSVYKDRKLN